MLINCPTCATSYHVGLAEIEGGRTVVCSRCETRWRVGLETPLFAVPAMPRLAAPDRLLAEPPRRETAPREPIAQAVVRSLKQLGTIALAGLALGAFTIAARARIVELVPRSAALYAAAGLPVNSRGLAFRHVFTSRIDPTAADIVVGGELRNVARRRVRVPRLTFDIRDADGRSLARWSETAPARTLAAGRTLSFSSTPHAVPPESRDVVVKLEADADDL